MESRAKAAGHALHQQLVVFPLGLLTTAVIFDVIRLVTDSDDLAVASYYMLAAGVVGGLAAAVFGTVDFMAVPPGTRARRVGAVHGAGSVVVVALFAMSWLWRSDEPSYIPSPAALALALAGAALAAVTGWLGGELVGRLGVGFDDDAHLDAPPAFTTGLHLVRGARTGAPRDVP